MKTCRICGKSKPLSEFYPMVGMRDGYRNECKRCNLDAKAARHRANPEPGRTRARQWAVDNPERLAERTERYRASGAKAASDRRSHLKRNYGVTPEDYDRMLADQDGGCAICGRAPTGISLHVDHEHGTGRIRGLLCFPCNNALGDFDDDRDLLAAAVRYLGPGPVDELMREAIQARVAALAAVGPAWAAGA